jgi:Concanavalin A-like lectin/glucanases superfamily
MNVYRPSETARRAGCLVVLGAAAWLVGAGCSSSNSTGGVGGNSGGGGTGGGETDAGADTAVDTGPTSCAGMAISLSANVATNGDPAKSHVAVDFGAADADLPIGNSPRTIEFWAYVLASSWAADANTMFEYGTTVANGGFGLDFGALPGRIDPYTNGSFDNDNQPSGISDATADQWIHFAMTYDQTAVTLYVNGIYMAGTQGARKTVVNGMLATVRSALSIGGNPRGAYFNGYLDEFRLWNVARSPSEIMANMNKTLTGDEAGLVGYWKFDDGDGTTAKDSVTAAGHTAHDGVLTATTVAMNPTWIPSTAPINCP